MTRLIHLLGGLFTMAALLTACGGDDDDNGAGPTPVTYDTFYVDIANTGTEDGSSAHPYNTLTEAITAAGSGDVLLIAAGDYDAGSEYTLHVNKGLTLKGVHRDSTRILCDISDQALNERRPVVLEDLYCQGFLCGRPTVTAQPTGAHAVRRCNVEGRIRMAHGGGFSLTVDSCTVTEEVTFAHLAAAWITRDAVRWCTIGDYVGFANSSGTGSADMVQVVIGCHPVNGIVYKTDHNAVDTVLNNIIETGGIDYRSAESDAYIAYNHILNGQICDASGEGRQLIVHNQISYDGSNDDLDPILIKESGASATIKHNTLLGGSDVTGIRLYSGDTTICDSNYIRTSGESACIETKAGFGQIIGNTLIGAWFGIHDDSRIAEIAYNTIDSCNYGVVTSGEGRYHHNTISNSNYDGMALSGAAGPVDHNTVTNSSWAGIRIILSGTDLGGGPDGGLGANTITGNAEGDLVNETADTIWAKYNFWDHTDSASIDGLDIYDDDDDGALGPVMFTPIGDL